MKKLTIIIPARYGSSRFEGKPLAMIAGMSMLQRVVNIATKATKHINGADIVVATEDERIRQHALDIGSKVVLTSDQCRTGSDRALDACGQLDYSPDYVINLQGDAPLTSPAFVEAIANELLRNAGEDVVTPVVQLSWQALDDLRESKKTTPFSGTTAIVSNGNALWFSKNIIPAIRKEEKLRCVEKLSPILKHVGLYGFKYAALKKFVSLEESNYEGLEGLEQLRMIEAGMRIKVIKVDFAVTQQIGVDTKEDLIRVEKIIEKYGEII